MTPEEKAAELVGKFKSLIWGATPFTRMERQKQCAIISVDEILSMLAPYKGMYDQDFYDNETHFWNQVKTEIQKL